jgi:hypothetical protein
MRTNSELKTSKPSRSSNPLRCESLALKKKPKGRDLPVRGTRAWHMRTIFRSAPVDSVLQPCEEVGRRQNVSLSRLNVSQVSRRYLKTVVGSPGNGRGALLDLLRFSWVAQEQIESRRKSRGLVMIHAAPASNDQG